MKKMKSALLFTFGLTFIICSYTTAAVKCRPSQAPLFSDESSDEVAEFTITADHDAINSVHIDTEDSAVQMPATPAIITYLANGKKTIVGARLSARGGSRLTCKIRPYKLDFESESFMNELAQGDDEIALLKSLKARRAAEPLTEGVSQKDNIFKMLGKNIKIVNPCEAGEPKWLGSPDLTERRDKLLTEYTIYKMFDVLKTSTLKVRLVKMTYKDQSGVVLFQDHALFREPESKAAERCDLKKGGGETDNDISVFNVTLQQNFIGGNDFGLWGQNVKLYHDAQNTTHYIGYDYDSSAFVTPFYMTETIAESLESMRYRLFLMIDPQNKNTTHLNEVKEFLSSREKMEQAVDQSPLRDSVKQDLRTKMRTQFKVLTDFLK